MGVNETYATTYSTFLFVVVIITALVFGGGGALGVVEGGAWSTLRWVVSTLPYLLLAWGTVLSFITLEYRYLIAPLIGVHAVVLGMICTWVFGKFLPVMVSSSAAILTYYTYDYMVEHAAENPMKNISMATLSLLLLLAQLLSTPASPPGTYLFTSSLMTDGLATVFGISIGLGGWFSTSLTSPESLPYSGKPHVSPVLAPTPNVPASANTVDTASLQAQLNEANKDLDYLHSLGITDPSANETLKRTLAKKASLEQQIGGGVSPAPTSGAPMTSSAVLPSKSASMHSRS